MESARGTAWAGGLEENRIERGPWGWFAEPGTVQCAGLQEDAASDVV